MFILGWLLIGLIGSFLLRYDYLLNFPEDGPYFCMSPLVYLIYLGITIFGPCLFGVSVLMVVFSGLVSDKENWLTRPICKKGK